MEKTATTYKSTPNGKTQTAKVAPGETPLFSTLSLVLIGIFAALAITFGVLWGLRYFGPDYQRQVQVLSVQADTLQSEAKILRETNAALREQLGLPLEVGFEVQIAAFEHFDLAASTDRLVRLAEVQQEGLNKYVLGRFSHFDEAEAFLKDMQKMGLYDAFIAGVAHGERVTVEEAKKEAKSYYGE